MPVPIPVSKVGSDSLKVKFLTISGRPKTRFSDQISAEFRNFPQFPDDTNHAVRVQGEGVGGLRFPRFSLIADVFGCANLPALSALCSVWCRVPLCSARSV